MLANQNLTGYALDKLFDQVRGGSFAVMYKDGSAERYGNGEPQFTVRLNDENVSSLIGEDMLTSFGEAYMDGRVDVEGDLADLLSLALQSGLMSVTQKTQGFAGAALRVAGKLRSLKHEKENIARHYDLGNDFFRLWLDESLTYSCAYFAALPTRSKRHSDRKLTIRLKHCGCSRMKLCSTSAAAGVRW